MKVAAYHRRPRTTASAFHLPEKVVLLQRSFGVCGVYLCNAVLCCYGLMVHLPSLLFLFLGRTLGETLRRLGH